MPGMPGYRRGRAGLGLRDVPNTDRNGRMALYRGCGNKYRYHLTNDIDFGIPYGMASARKRDLMRRDMAELRQTEETLLDLIMQRDALHVQFALLGVTRMDKAEHYLKLFQSVLAEKESLAEREGRQAPPRRNEVAVVTKQTRKDMGLTQTEFGKRLGVRQLSVTRWERGQMGMRLPTWKLLLRLAAEQAKA